MNNSVFSTGIYRESMRRLRMPAIFMLIIVCIQSVFVPLILYVVRYKRLTGDMEDSVNFMVAQMATLGGMVILIPLMAEILFGFINHRNSSDFWHSLPVKRSALYNSYLLALLSWAAVIYAVSMLLTLFSYGIMPRVSISFEEFWDYLRISFILALYFLSVELLAKNIAGTKLSIMCSGIFIIFFPRGILTFIRLMIEAACNYVIMDETSIIWGNSYNLVWRLMNLEIGRYSDTVYPSVESSFAYTTILALVFIAVAGVLFVKRRSEKAEDVAVSPLVQRMLSFVPPIVFGFLPCGYIIAFIFGGEDFDGDQLVFLIVLFIIAIIIYLLYELITVRKWAAVKKAAKSIWVIFAIYAIIIGGICANIALIKSQRPTEDQIEYVQIYDNTSSRLSEKLAAEFAKIRYSDPELKKLVADTLGRTIDEDNFGNLFGGYGYRVTIRYSGRTIYRQLSFDSDTLASLFKKNPEYLKCYYDLIPDFDHVISADVYGLIDGDSSVSYNNANFYKAIKADKESMTPAQWAEYTSVGYWYRYRDEAKVSLCWTVPRTPSLLDHDSYDNNYVMLLITEDNRDKFPNTINAIMEIKIKGDDTNGYYYDNEEYYRKYYD
ncbi:MAG: hypothetical protein IKN24_03530 [Lachnospiraceae bacterium]|nr:hypothetical protein [Lachnospiraceae bacterium]